MFSKKSLHMAKLGIIQAITGRPEAARLGFR